MAGEISTRKQGKLPRGGKRPNAGRKRSRELRYDPSHAARPELSFKNPVHTMLRTLPSVPRLRQRAAYEAIRATLVHFLDGEDFRVVHVSIQANHLHLIVEAANKRALHRGMQRLAIRAARALNAAFEQTGKVFAFRYQAKQIKSASYARNAIAYVLPRKPLHALPGFERDFIAERFELLRPLACGFRSRSLRQVVRTEVYKGLVAAQHFVRGDQKLVCDGYECAQGPPASA
jgi:REP element-mobilizing transposase RayT